MGKQRVLRFNMKGQYVKGKNINQLSSKLMICRFQMKWMKRQAANWEKVFANHISSKKLLFRMYKIP